MITEEEYMKKQYDLDKQISKLDEEKFEIFNKIKALRQEKEELRIKFCIVRLQNKQDPAAQIKQDPATQNKQEPATQNNQHPATQENQDPATQNKQDPTTQNKQDPTTPNKQALTTRNKQDPTTRHKQDPPTQNKRDLATRRAQEYPWSEKVYNLLKTTFAFNEFRLNQLAAINATLSKRDVIVIMPTGGGKSLVYQLPSLVTGKLSIVMSPLISVINDQLMVLNKLGIPAATINSTSTLEHKLDVASQMLKGKVKIIFVTTGWFAKATIFVKRLTEMHKSGRLGRFVIDEVHCCSQRGHDFRKDYLCLSLVKGQFPGVPILGLTATATSNVLVDIKKVLQLPDPIVISARYNRPNLYYEVMSKPEENSDLIDYLEMLLKGKYKGQSGLIYAGTYTECEDIARVLKERGVKIAAYHAGLDTPEKSRVHKRWVHNIYQVVIGTVAFGIGIDKPDVRFVIHYTLPKSIEGLYQESGRAGHDGQKADCVLMFSLIDWLRLFSIAQDKRAEKRTRDVLQYSINVTKCRREIISGYFEDNWRSSDCEEMCDHCKNILKVVDTYDIASCLTRILQLINIASAKEINLTLKKLLDTWFQIGPKSLQLSDSKPRFAREQAEYIIAFLLSKNLLIVRRSLVSCATYIDTNLDVSKKFKGPIPMDYIGVIEGVPLYTGCASDIEKRLEEIAIQLKRLENKTKRSEEPALQLERYNGNSANYKSFNATVDLTAGSGDSSTSDFSTDSSSTDSSSSSSSSSDSSYPPPKRRRQDNVN